MRVLAVDDDELMRMLLNRQLTHAGHNAATAADGVEALEKCTQDNFQVVICDWEMPRMNGIELCKSLRALPDGAKYYLIVLSGHESAEERQLATAAGADAFLTKPCKPATLVAAVKAAEQAAANANSQAA